MVNTLASAEIGLAGEKAARSVADRRRFSTFAVLAAIAAIAWQTDILNLSTGANWQSAATLAAFVVLILPASPAALLALAAIESGAIFRALPETNTNRLLQFFVFGTLTVTGFYVLARHRFRRFDRGEWLELFQPLLRLELLIVYVLAGWHKLNTGFFDAQNSCAVLMYQRLGLPLSGDFMRWALIAGTVTSELGLPVLLTFRRTRNFGVWYGVAFHVALGVDGAWSFSATMIALLFLFAPDAFCEAAVKFVRRPRMAIAAAAVLSVVLFFAIRHIHFLAALLHGQAFRITGPSMWKDLGYWLFVCLSPLALAFYLWVRWRRPDYFQTAVHCCRPIPRLLWILPALLVFDGLTPYLGLKTETAFAMYSNLRTEGEETNHLVWRHRLDLADYQRDLVRILGTNDEMLETQARSGVDVPFYVLRRRIADLAHAGVKGVAVTYVRGGKTITQERAETIPELATMPSWLERKTLRFRSIDVEGCSH
jgi:hypothetical protein